MKFEIEVKDEMIKYSYHISEHSHGGGSMPLTLENHDCIVKMLSYVGRNESHKIDTQFKKISAGAFMETNFEEAEEMMKRAKEYHKRNKTKKLNGVE